MSAQLLPWECANKMMRLKFSIAVFLQHYISIHSGKECDVLNMRHPGVGLMVITLTLDL